MARRSVEERKNIKRAVWFGILTVGALLFFLYVGFPAIARFATFLTGFRNSNQPAEQNDTTPPAPPRLQTESEVTNKVNVKVEGTTEPGATVILKLNGKEVELLANKDGEFSHDFALKKGENTASAKAIDTVGNESQESELLIIIQDDEEPELTINSPADGTTFYGSRERQVTIEGQTEEGASVTINERVVVVSATGSFTYTISLADGENTFNIIAQDQAGNTEEASLTLHYSP